MDKERVAELLDSYVQGINEKFEVFEESGDLNISVDGDIFAFFQDYKISLFEIVGNGKYDNLIAQTGIIQKFYMKACELLESLKKKYSIQIIEDNERTYLNVVKFDEEYFFDDRDQANGIKTAFTQEEIEKLKQCQDIAIDWDKAIINEVEE